ncbi:MAG: ABC transporter substrate-binding protein [Dehalococcoidia bacterium]
MTEEANYWKRAISYRATRRSILRGGIAGAGLVGLTAVGCGGSSSNNKNSSNSGGTTSQATTAATSAPASATATSAAAPAGTQIPAAGTFKTGGTIQLAFVVAAPLDPYENSTYSAQDVVGFVYSRLFRFNSGPDPNTNLTRQPIPELVSSYEISPDGLTYTMKLRQGVMWHPPLSRLFTSADVMASWQRFTTDSKNTNSGVYKPIVDTLTAPDDNTIVFKLKQPYAPFINKLANTQYLWIMSQEAVSGKIDPSQQVVGTGPWIFVSKTPTAFTYKKNPDYFIKGIPYADGVVLNIIPDTSTQEAQFQAGKLDALAISVADRDSLKKAVPKAASVEYVPDGLSFLYFSNVSDSASPFNDVRMRRAASLAIDRPGLIDAIYSGAGTWCNLVPGGLGKWWLDPQGKDIGSAGQWFKHDPAQAKALLTAAGHADTQFKFLYPNNAYGDVYNSHSDALRGMLADAGFKLQVVTVDYLKDYINNGQGIFFKGPPPNTIVHGLQTPFTDPDDFLTGMLTQGGNRNHDNINDPDLAAIIQQEQKETDDAKRLQLVYKATQMADDKMYYPPTVYTKVIIMNQPWVQNFFVADDYAYGTEQVAYMSVNNK